MAGGRGGPLASRTGQVGCHGAIGQTQRAVFAPASLLLRPYLASLVKTEPSLRRRHINRVWLLLDDV